MKIVLSADHRGADTVTHIAEKLTREGYEVSVLGPCEGAPCDYPERAYEVGRAVASGGDSVGILLCGTGIGMAMAANKIARIRAAVVHDELTAQLSRSHNDANILCLSADLLGQRLIEKIIDIWLRTEFEGGRHARRVRKIEAIERGEDPASVRDE